MAEEKKPQRIAKERKVERIREKMHSASSVILSDYRGLDVEKVSDLRKKLRGEGIEYEVIKNTLIRLAVKGERYEKGLLPYLKGPTAIAFGYEDPLRGVKILTNFSREHEALSVKVGIVEGKLIDRERIGELARLPSYEGLLSLVTLVIKYPLQGLMNVLKGNMRNLVFTLKNIGAVKEGGS
ncbi:50S ribosomal protein L10 [bacterium]|nr:50S ribosomal protein L10 [bacterium]